MDVSSAVIRTLDESIRPFLSEGRAWYHSWLSTSTFFVGFGVVLEAPEIFHELYRELSEYLVHRRRQRLSLDTFGFRVPRPGQAHLPWGANHFANRLAHGGRWSRWRIPIR